MPKLKISIFGCFGDTTIFGNHYIYVHINICLYTNTYHHTRIYLCIYIYIHINLSIQMDTKWCHPNICIGTGKYPRCDPWGRPFTAQYHPHRMRLAGKRIAGNYVGVLEAFQGDQDFIRILFSPSRCIAAFLGNYKYVGFIRFAPHHYIADLQKKSFNHQTMQPRFFFQAILLLLLQGMSMGLSR